MLKKIHIVGGPGSGKSFLAKRLSDKLGIDSYNLDDIFWDNSKNSYGIKALPEIRDKKLHAIVNEESWIIEGVYYSWLYESFLNADCIFILKTKVLQRDFRIIKRFLSRKFGLLACKKKETIRGLMKLLEWNHSYDKDNLVKAEEMIRPFMGKVHCFTQVKSINEYIDKI